MAVLSGLVLVMRHRVALALVAAIAGIALVRDTYDITPYTSADPTLAYLVDQAPDGHRVGLAGVWSPSGISPVLPAFGPRLGNRVAFLGPFKDHLLQPETDPERFKDRLDGYDLLVVGRGITPAGPVPEEQWAQAAGFEPVVASDRLALYKR
jgi:hypothetical protein